MNPPRHAIGVDIGGTKTAVGVVTSEGRVLARQTIATESRRGTESGTERITQAIHRALQDSGVCRDDLAGVGVGCAGPIDSETGAIHNPYTLPGWEEWNIVSAMGRELGLPVWLENDADTAALGEFYFGAGQTAEVLAMLTFGTGVGGAVLVRGEIYRGARGEHPEFGHMAVSSGGEACYCGRSGCLESITSGTALALAGRRAGGEGPAQVFSSAASGDLEALRVLAGVREAIAIAIWNLRHVFAPDRIVLGGGLPEANPDFFIQAARATSNQGGTISTSVLEIAVARLGNQAGLIGAARWAIERHTAIPPSSCGVNSSSLVSSP
jgi:glucokinase